jgi:hypothetical protein
MTDTCYRCFRSCLLFALFGVFVPFSLLDRSAVLAETQNYSSVQVGEFQEEIRTAYTTEHGLPSDLVTQILIDQDHGVVAVTDQGVARFTGQAFETWELPKGKVQRLIATPDGMLAIAGGKLVRCQDDEIETVAELPERVAGDDAVRSVAVAGDAILLGTTSGMWSFSAGQFGEVEDLNRRLRANRDVRQIAVSTDGMIAVAAHAGLFIGKLDDAWRRLLPRDEKRSWSPYDVRGVAFDQQQNLWFASPQGVGCHQRRTWELFTGLDGLPYDDFTRTVCGQRGKVWFGTTMGAIWFDGSRWAYRQGKRWLPDDHVNDIAVAADGTAWVATAGGVSRIELRTTTLADKARRFEEAIDKYHRRTPFGYVLDVSLPEPGDKSKWVQHDSDNDGLWTSMYGAGECFAYGATKDPEIKKRANAAFQAVRFLSQVTQGGEISALPGFPARTILPTSGPDPNEVYTLEKDREKKKNDPMWKVIHPRWPVSADGKWYWKCDTSSDELDGHFFLYAVYHDLVAETAEEKAQVRDVVLAITDHLIDHDFALVDHDGKPTRWAQFGPQALNSGPFWVERGLNSLSILSYLKVAEHVSGGEQKYREAFERLVKEHSYAANTLDPKLQNGVGSGNQSDDEMAFMCYYNLLNYTKDPALRKIFMISLQRYWGLVRPERCPLFNFIFAARYRGDAIWQADDVGLSVDRFITPCIQDGVKTLIRFPSDRIRWGFQNSHRTDVVELPHYLFDAEGRGSLRTGQVIPIDERFVNYWNHDVWQLDEQGGGRSLGDGAAFLLPYYMGLYHGFIAE